MGLVFSNILPSVRGKQLVSVSWSEIFAAGREGWRKQRHLGQVFSLLNEKIRLFLSLGITIRAESGFVVILLVKAR